jgi:serine/threonine-protein kinase
MFPSNSPWNQRIDGAGLDPASDAIIASLQNAWSHHGEPNDNPGHMHVDFSLDVLCAGEGTPFRSFSKNSSWYEGECDDVQMPVPVGGNVEGQPGYQCPIADEDCHLLVVHTPTRTLYEQIAVNIDAGGYSGGCVARWDMTRTYPPSLRGEQCTSADAAALPIAALLFDADEVAAGAIEHAVRFAISNDKIRHSQYVRPAAHATGAASGGATALPYGVRLRLKSTFDVATLPSAGARVVATALKRYGMILADGGQVVLMGQSDRHTVAKWSGRLAPHDLEALRPDNFEVVNMGTVFTWTGDCVLE